MEKYYSGFAAVVVGHGRQRLVQETADHLDRLSIPFEICEDIYSAAATIATSLAGSNLLVIGCFSAMTAENMRFFSLSPKDKKVSFCCIVQKWSDTMQPSATAAAQAGVIVINTVQQLESIIKQCKGPEPAAVRPKATGRDFASRIASLADNFFLTQAEQDALLGVNDNANTENHFVTE
ncbi:MAG: hypothetical protein Q7T18_09980 [Sedimentisphaerales bacterium]|nr:hypothetical protein [Sedimentisphaerales bacterium]